MNRENYTVCCQLCNFKINCTFVGYFSECAMPCAQVLFGLHFIFKHFKNITPSFLCKFVSWCLLLIFLLFFGIVRCIIYPLYLLLKSLVNILESIFGL